MMTARRSATQALWESLEGTAAIVVLVEEQHSGVGGLQHSAGISDGAEMRSLLLPRRRCREVSRRGPRRNTARTHKALHHQMQRRITHLRGFWQRNLQATRLCCLPERVKVIKIHRSCYPSSRPHVVQKAQQRRTLFDKTT
ncbi:unnamed protein product [Amoebophrya sp. A120]|nr:unnamed protein product [Amoebophrya sp. A120]|eukprot:GSA120T00005147001.1